MSGDNSNDKSQSTWVPACETVTYARDPTAVTHNQREIVGQAAAPAVIHLGGASAVVHLVAENNQEVALQQVEYKVAVMMVEVNVEEIDQKGSHLEKDDVPCVSQLQQNLA